MKFTNAEVPTRSLKKARVGKSPRVNTVVWKSTPQLNSPRTRVLDQIPLYTAQQYWEDLGIRRMVLPDFTGRNKSCYTYNIDHIQSLRSGQAREPSPKGQNPTTPGALDVQSILKNHRHCRSPRDHNVPEFFNPLYQHSYTELVKLSTNLLHTPDRFERWVPEPMVNMRYMNIPFNTEGHLCHYYKQPTMWLNPCHFANIRAVTKETTVDSHIADRKSKWQKKYSANGVMIFPTKPEH